MKGGQTMRRIIETLLILLLCLLTMGSIPVVAGELPVVLASIILSYLAIFSGVRHLEWLAAGVYLGIWIFQSQAAVLAPLLVYALLQRTRPLAVLPLGISLATGDPRVIMTGLAGLWLSWQEIRSREREKAYLAMRDDFVQNEILQHRILKEEELNHQKNLEIAVLRERNRISREIHDSVGHTISAAILQIEAMKITAKDPVKSRLTGLSEALAAGMDEVRTSLHNLHSESISLQAEISRLIEPMAGGYEIIRSIGLDDAAPVAVKRAMLTLVREALTNIRRHSDADTVRIILRELPRHYTITVKDNGSPSPVKSGMGLISLDELSRSLGGSLSHGWSDGFFVHMTLPRQEAENPENTMTGKTGKEG